MASKRPPEVTPDGNCGICRAGSGCGGHGATARVGVDVGESE